jgi:[ribosomal protein S5]-alanine N-acetyltransferase
MRLNKDIFLTGENIYLRILNENDIEGNYAKWLNDPDITTYNSHGRFPMTKENLLSFVKDSLKSNSTLVLAVVFKQTEEHIGNISLQNINWIDRNAEIAFVLGEKKYWGKNLMYEAGKMLIDHGFKMLNLHRIHCGTSSDNIGMQRLADKLGFKIEGVRKDAIFKSGRYIDIIEYGIVN